MPPFLALIPTKDWIYLSLIIAVLIGFGSYTIHERHVGAAKEVAALTKSSDELNRKADAKIVKLNTEHATQVATIIGVIDNERKANVSAAASDAQRLREYDAYRRAHPPVGRPASGPQDQNDGSGSADKNADRSFELEQDALNLADAGRSVLTALGSCMIERDSLTGK